VDVPVYRKYKENVPDKISEAAFWSEYLTLGIYRLQNISSSELFDDVVKNEERGKDQMKHPLFDTC